MGQMLMLFIGVITAAIYILIYLIGNKKYQSLAAAVREDVFPIKEIFPFGLFVLLDVFKTKPRLKKEKTKNKYKELFGEQYIDFYALISHAAVISYIAMLIPFAFFFGGMANSAALVFIVLIVAIIIAIMPFVTMDDKIKNQRNEILLAYPNVLSKMALLINAGMMLREAWAMVANSDDTKIYREMRNVMTLINNGMPEIEAYEKFADACKVNEIKKFVSIICQNVTKGSAELVYIMKELSVEAWNTKKTVAKMKGDSAQTKLIIPLMISFAGILAMIMVPIVANMNMGI